MSYFFVAKSAKVFTNGSDVVHPAHCLTRRDVAVFSGNSQLRCLHWSDADRVELRLRDHKNDRVQVGSVVVRTRSEVRGPCSELGEGGGAVALMVTLMSCHAALPEHSPLSSYRLGGGGKSVGIYSGAESAERGRSKVRA